MRQLMILNPENATDEEVGKFPIRKASHAVVIDEENNIALLHVTKEGYFKLPGGGIEGEEDPHTALYRECKEEIGCDVTIISDIGTIVEHRKMYQIKQISYCYLAKVKREKGTPRFTDEEKAEGFSVVWLPYDQVLKAVSESKTTSPEGSLYIKPRDTLFLQAANEFLEVERR